MKTYQEAVREYLANIIMASNVGITQAMRKVLNAGVTGDYHGDNAVAALWFADDFLTTPTPGLLALAGAGKDRALQFEGGESLSMNVENKGRLCAQTGVDTLTIATTEKHHFLAASGKFFPWGGAIIRRIGRVEFVLVTSGFNQEEDHKASEDMWKGINVKLLGQISQGLKLAALEPDDPRAIKYLEGGVISKLTTMVYE